jgi:hypothetical protein
MLEAQLATGEPRLVVPPFDFDFLSTFAIVSPESQPRWVKFASPRDISGRWTRLTVGDAQTELGSGGQVPP